MSRIDMTVPFSGPSLVYIMKDMSSSVTAQHVSQVPLGFSRNLYSSSPEMFRTKKARWRAIFYEVNKQIEAIKAAVM